MFASRSFLDHLLEAFADVSASFLSEEHDLETFEIVQLSTGSVSINFDGVG